MKNYLVLASEISSLSEAAEISGFAIGDVLSDISDVESKLSDLSASLDYTSSVINEYSISGSGAEEIDWENLLFPTSPFAIGRDLEYGGTQKAPYELFLKYLKYIQSLNRSKRDIAGAPFNPNGPSGTSPSQPGVTLTDSEMQKVEAMIDLFNQNGIYDKNVMFSLLNTLKNQACGHTVITNWICEDYSSNPQEFEDKYGYPLFVENENGELTYNYEVLLVDTFLESNEQFLSDNITEDGFVMDNPDASIHADEMVSRYSQILGEDVEGVVVQHDVSVETYQKYLEEGYNQVCVAAYRFDMLPYGSNTSSEMYMAARDTEDGHWMTVTGISENRNLIVSSWGQEWELTHSDLYALFPVDGVQSEDRDDPCLVFIKK